jgi:hypothetical protein
MKRFTKYMIEERKVMQAEQTLDNVSLWNDSNYFLKPNHSHAIKRNARYASQQTQRYDLNN